MNFTEIQFQEGRCTLCQEDFAPEETILAHEKDALERICAVHDRCLYPWVVASLNNDTCPGCGERITSIEEGRIPVIRDVSTQRWGIEQWVKDKTGSECISLFIPGALEAMERITSSPDFASLVRFMRTGRNAFYVSIPIIAGGIALGTHTPANPSIESVISPIANIMVLGGGALALAGIERVHRMCTIYFPQE